MWTEVWNEGGRRRVAFVEIDDETERSLFFNRDFNRDQELILRLFKF